MYSMYNAPSEWPEYSDDNVASAAALGPELDNVKLMIGDDQGSDADLEPAPDLHETSDRSNYDDSLHETTPVNMEERTPNNASVQDEFEVSSDDDARPSADFDWQESSESDDFFTEPSDSEEYHNTPSSEENGMNEYFEQSELGVVGSDCYDTEPADEELSPEIEHELSGTLEEQLGNAKDDAIEEPAEHHCVDGTKGATDEDQYSDFQGQLYTKTLYMYTEAKHPEEMEKQQTETIMFAFKWAQLLPLWSYVRSAIQSSREVDAIVDDNCEETHATKQETSIAVTESKAITYSQCTDVVEFENSNENRTSVAMKRQIIVKDFKLQLQNGIVKLGIRYLDANNQEVVILWQWKLSRNSCIGDIHCIDPKTSVVSAAKSCDTFIIDEGLFIERSGPRVVMVVPMDTATFCASSVPVVKATVELTQTLTHYERKLVAAPTKTIGCVTAEQTQSTVIQHGSLCSATDGTQFENVMKLCSEPFECGRILPLDIERKLEQVKQREETLDFDDNYQTKNTSTITELHVCLLEGNTADSSAESLRWVNAATEITSDNAEAHDCLNIDHDHCLLDDTRISDVGALPVACEHSMATFAATTIDELQTCSLDGGTAESSCESLHWANAATEITSDNAETQSCLSSDQGDISQADTCSGDVGTGLVTCELSVTTSAAATIDELQTCPLEGDSADGSCESLHWANAETKLTIDNPETQGCLSIDQGGISQHDTCSGDVGTGLVTCELSLTTSAAATIESGSQTVYIHLQNDAELRFQHGDHNKLLVEGPDSPYVITVSRTRDEDTMRHRRTNKAIRKRHNDQSDTMTLHVASVILQIGHQRQTPKLQCIGGTFKCCEHHRRFCDCCAIRDRHSVTLDCRRIHLYVSEEITVQHGADNISCVVSPEYLQARNCDADNVLSMTRQFAGIPGAQCGNVAVKVRTSPGRSLRDRHHRLSSQGQNDARSDSSHDTSETGENMVFGATVPIDESSGHFLHGSGCSCRSMQTTVNSWSFDHSDSNFDSSSCLSLQPHMPVSDTVWSSEAHAPNSSSGNLPIEPRHLSGYVPIGDEPDLECDVTPVYDEIVHPRQCDTQESRTTGLLMQNLKEFDQRHEPVPDDGQETHGGMLSSSRSSRRTLSDTSTVSNASQAPDTESEILAHNPSEPRINSPSELRRYSAVHRCACLSNRTHLCSLNQHATEQIVESLNSSEFCATLRDVGFRQIDDSDVGSLTYIANDRDVLMEASGIKLFIEDEVVRCLLGAEIVHGVFVEGHDDVDVEVTLCRYV